MLLPALDEEKHYYIGDAEVDKLLRHGEGWLGKHPERQLIVQRYLKRRSSLIDQAMARLLDEENAAVEAVESKTEQAAVAEKDLERPMTLHTQRLNLVATKLKALEAKTILDLGCGEGKLLRRLLADRAFERITGMDVSHRSLEVASSRLRLDRMPERQRKRIQLMQGSLLYRDKRLSGFDAAALVEVIEHLDRPRLVALERVLFEFARPRHVVITTPNREYNVLFPTLPPGKMRHSDHRFEWTRAEFAEWAEAIAARFGYEVRFETVGPVDDAARRTITDGGLLLPTGGRRMKTIEIPELALVALIGASGSGKSTFARRHFLPTEVLSSDFFRGLVSDDENDQTCTHDAFDALYYMLEKRLARGKLTVVDATNVRAEDRKRLVEHARKYHCFAVAIVVNTPERVCQERNRSRPDRDFGPHVVRRQIGDLKRGLRGLEREGFRYVHILDGSEEIEIRRAPLWNNKKDQTGPFDIFGDLHGCADELRVLLEQTGWERFALPDPDTAWGDECWRHSAGRRAIFLGDLVDRGPHVLDTVRIVRNMVTAGTAFCVAGNHDVKFMRWLRGKQVQVKHGLEQSIAEVEPLAAEDRSKIASFLDGLVSHYVLDGGNWSSRTPGFARRCTVAAPAAVREFCLYGETTGETDEFGLPVRYNWASEYRGKATVVYGHTPVPEPEWLNNTVNIDTGAVFGGKLTALRYPEREFVSVAAAREYATPIRPFAQPAPDARTSQQISTTCSIWRTSPASASSKRACTAPSPSVKRIRLRLWR